MSNLFNELDKLDITSILTEEEEVDLNTIKETKIDDTTKTTDEITVEAVAKEFSDTMAINGVNDISDYTVEQATELTESIIDRLNIKNGSRLVESVLSYVGFKTKSNKLNESEEKDSIKSLQSEISALNSGIEGLEKTDEVSEEDTFEVDGKEYTKSSANKRIDALKKKLDKLNKDKNEDLDNAFGENGAESIIESAINPDVDNIDQESRDKATIEKANQIAGSKTVIDNDKFRELRTKLANRDYEVVDRLKDYALLRGETVIYTWLRAEDENLKENLDVNITDGNVNVNKDGVNVNVDTATSAVNVDVNDGATLPDTPVIDAPVEELPMDMPTEELPVEEPTEELPAEEPELTDELEESVDWGYFDKFNSIIDEYMPDRGEGETMASQIVTAVNKLIYKCYNDGDVFDNTYHLEGWANDLSDFANWLAKYVDGAKPILDRIKEITSMNEYEDLLKDLADELLDEDLLKGYASQPASENGSIYDCSGDYSFDEHKEDEEDDDWYDDSEDEEYESETLNEAKVTDYVDLDTIKACPVFKGYEIEPLDGMVIKATSYDGEGAKFTEELYKVVKNDDGKFEAYLVDSTGKALGDPFLLEAGAEVNVGAKVDIPDDLASTLGTALLADEDIEEAEGVQVDNVPGKNDQGRRIELAKLENEGQTVYRVSYLNESDEEIVGWDIDAENDEDAVSKLDAFQDADEVADDILGQEFKDSGVDGVASLFYKGANISLASDEDSFMITIDKDGEDPVILNGSTSDEVVAALILWYVMNTSSEEAGLETVEDVVETLTEPAADLDNEATSDEEPTDEEPTDGEEGEDKLEEAEMYSREVVIPDDMLDEISDFDEESGNYTLKGEFASLSFIPNLEAEIGNYDDAQPFEVSGDEALVNKFIDSLGLNEAEDEGATAVEVELPYDFLEEYTTFDEETGEYALTGDYADLKLTHIEEPRETNFDDTEFFKLEGDSARISAFLDEFDLRDNI